MNLSPMDKAMDEMFQPNDNDLSDRIEELEAAMRRAADIIDRNLYHQQEKIADASSILRDALNDTSV